MGTCRIGCSVRDLLQCMNGVPAARTGVFSGASTSLEVLLSVFAKEEYLLWWNATQCSSVIVLKDQANVRTQLKAWSHALIMARFYQKVAETHDALNKHGTEDLLEETLATHTEQFDNQLARLEKVGWNLNIGVLETRPGKRIVLPTQVLQHQSADWDWHVPAYWQNIGYLVVVASHQNYSCCSCGARRSFPHRLRQI